MVLTGLTKGQYRVGKNFNPSQDPGVQKIKQLSAELIDVVDDIVEIPEHSQEQRRLKDLAQTALEEAAMWAVKAQTKALTK